ncbi:hypothetical protein PIB30_029327 [Stylosanthes scabra]|uniref:Uncharacterized protein n=1 Tax=Stylosanthes scabra TaxID=79078 RepID=A0ABU6QC09_9FABA|nr:hypothetical protein [Stylosanthes scabra]
MGSGVIYYEYEEREKFKDYDMKADMELGTFNIKRYHFGDESFVHPLHSVRFDPDCLYEIPIEALMADQPLSSSEDGKSHPTPHYSPKGLSSAQRVRSSSSAKGTSSSRRRVASKTSRMPRSWELIPPSEGWMCEGDDEKEIGGMEPSVEKDDVSEEDLEEDEEEEDPKEEIPAFFSLPMDIGATEDYLQFIEELERRPEYSLIPSSHASVPDSPDNSADR